MSRIIVSIITFFVCSSVFSLSGSITPDAIAERLTPVGNVIIDGAAPAKKSSNELTPNKIYKKYCYVCHQTGVAGAPKFQNAADWKSRLAEGWDTVMKKAIQGYGAMPAKGTCTKCTEEMIAETIKYMSK